MDPDHAAKFAIHEASREGKSMLYLIHREEFISDARSHRC